jgi:Cu(I)/Ag(I) efflux system membrane fusion protein
MDLVPAESLGFASARDGNPDAPLVIPATAALLTGKRAVVYVEQPEAERPTYIGREVVLGPRAGDSYVVKSGLAEGELVVISGNFKIDSALQIQAKPSMMNPDGGKRGGDHSHHDSHGGR